jgi:hypothetical protein
MAKLDDFWSLRKETQIIVGVGITMICAVAAIRVTMNPEVPKDGDKASISYTLVIALNAFAATIIVMVQTIWVMYKRDLPLLPCLVNKFIMEYKRTMISIGQAGKADAFSSAVVEFEASRISSMRKKSSAEKKSLGVREAQSLFESLRALLRDPDGFRFFCRHLVSEFNIENMLFLIESQQYLDYMLPPEATDMAMQTAAIDVVVAKTKSPRLSGRSHLLTDDDSTPLSLPASQPSDTLTMSGRRPGLALLAPCDTTPKDSADLEVVSEGASDVGLMSPTSSRLSRDDTENSHSSELEISVCDESIQASDAGILELFGGSILTIMGPSTRRHQVQDSLGTLQSALTRIRVSGFVKQPVKPSTPVSMTPTFLSVMSDSSIIADGARVSVTSSVEAKSVTFAIPELDEVSAVGNDGRTSMDDSGTSRDVDDSVGRGRGISFHDLKAKSKKEKKTRAKEKKKKKKKKKKDKLLRVEFADTAPQSDIVSNSGVLNEHEMATLLFLKYIVSNAQWMVNLSSRCRVDLADKFQFKHGRFVRSKMHRAMSSVESPIQTPVPAPIVKGGSLEDDLFGDLDDEAAAAVASGHAVMDSGLGTAGGLPRAMSLSLSGSYRREMDIVGKSGKYQTGAKLLMASVTPFELSALFDDARRETWRLLVDAYGRFKGTLQYQKWLEVHKDVDE